MTRRTRLGLWALEFVSVILIGVIQAAQVSLWWLSLPVVGILVAKFVEYCLDARERRLTPLRQQLQILLQLLPCDHANIRCTYHVPRHHVVKRHTVLKQAFDYLPTGGGGGRRFSTSKGIIGKTFETKAPRVENFSSDAEYRTRMVSEYNYTVSELGHRTADRRSYLCYPILDESHVILGLIYFDSDRCGLFTIDDLNPRWAMIRRASEVIRGEIL